MDNRNLSKPQETIEANGKNYIPLTAKNVAKQTMRGLEMIGTATDRFLGLPGRATAHLMGATDYVPREFSNQVGEAVGQGTGNRRLGMLAGFTAGIASPDPFGEVKAVKKLANSGMKFYHASNKKNIKSILKYGIDVSKNTKGHAESPYAFFTAPNLEDAKWYGDEVVELTPIDNLKILDQSSQKWADTMGKSKGVKDSTRIAEELRKEGYDLIDAGNEHMILNPSKFRIRPVNYK